ncbi:MAG TPA: DUF4412 domain-containing protein [Elusimicrobiota bacterium]|nr:DUF4412 domain-containing protein [Elusimicrobiota bacterium]
MKKITLFLSVLLSAGLSFAEFEGVLHIKMSAGPTSGNGTILVSKSGVRNELNMQTPQKPVRMTSLLTAKNPATLYVINDEKKTYSEMDLDKTRRAAEKAERASYKVKRLPDETLLGYRCAHVFIAGSGGESELWTSREIMDYDTFARMNAGKDRGPADGAYGKALKEAGADGFPLKSIHRAGKEGVTVVEVVRVEKKPISPAMFEVPAGYQKTGLLGAGPAATSMPPDAMKRMEEQMKNMPAEQREMIEKMMKQGGQP